MLEYSPFYSDAFILFCKQESTRFQTFNKILSLQISLSSFHENEAIFSQNRVSATMLSLALEISSSC